MNRFKNILYLLGNSFDAAAGSLQQAVSLAQNNQASLTLLYVLPQLSLSSYAKEVSLPPGEQGFQERLLDHEQARLRKLADTLNQDITINLEVRIGKKHLQTVEAVHENHFDLIIKEAEHSGWISRIVGGTDMHLLRKCPCPVWLIKRHQEPAYRQIMVAVDFDTDNEDKAVNEALNQSLVDMASSLAIAEFASLHIVNIYDVPEAGFISSWTDQPVDVENQLFEAEFRRREHKMHALLDYLKSSLGEKSYQYLSPLMHIIQGVPEHEIPKVAATIPADLVVMGTVARAGLSGILIGNTAEGVVSQLDCSILAIKPKSFTDSES